ncbi:DUF4129 domain-containing protein [Pseudomonas sp. HR96]|uniref:DUF4129 domain-containing protein n=1 Tax=Pseudomonas sp. HR96 TaxID=1027966 RepID=UPI002A759722|nr:DUF4129 domain-containing protein [Pseudomonas sp. HR96]WPO99127.1 DUF4129 domain-containing protein [Pseudomonas sp. HR96]
MRVTDTAAVLRPRSPWQAIDLGLLLAGRHRRVLILSWACLTMPVLAVLSWVLRDHPNAVLLVLWWLKPAFERLPLDILAQAWQGTAPSLGQALRRYPQLLKTQLWPALTVRRLSLSRSLTLPVSQLEGLDGPARQRRITLLRKDNRGAARWLTLLFAHIEYVFGLALVVVLYALQPDPFDSQWHLGEQLGLSASLRAAWPAHLSNLIYALVLTVTEPLYVAAGFGLYLNRRSQLEAWDIEQVLRRLAARLGSAIGAVLMAVLLAWPSAPSLAAPPPDSPRLLNQKLSSDAARSALQAIEQQPPFHNLENQRHWRWVHGDGEPASEVPLPASVPRFEGLARLLESLLWVLLLAAVVLLGWRYRHWLALFARPAPTPPAHPEPPQVVAGIALQAQALPADIAGSAERLWPEQPREALSLLYRALLLRLLQDYQLPLKAADTESQVLARIEQLGQPPLFAFGQALTEHWQNLAYGHRLPPEAAGAALCAHWRALFDGPRAEPAP